MRRNQRQTRNQFTLREPLVVIAILVALLLSVLKPVREAAKNQACKSNL